MSKDSSTASEHERSWCEVNPKNTELESWRWGRREEKAQNRGSRIARVPGTDAGREGGAEMPFRKDVILERAHIQHPVDVTGSCVESVQQGWF